MSIRKTIIKKMRIKNELINKSCLNFVLKKRITDTIVYVAL